MANFLISTAGTILSGSSDGDLFEFITGGSSSTVKGKEGADTLRASAVALANVTFFGNTGDDIVRVSGSDFTNNNLQLGRGNDTALFGGTGTVVNASTIKGKLGNDVIDFNASALSATASALSIRGNQDNDTLSVTGAGNHDGVTIAGGGGADTINIADGETMSAGKIVGGLGEDTFNISGGTYNNTKLFAGAESKSSDADSADTLNVTGLTLNSSNVRLYGGNDTITVGSGNYNDATLRGGEGADTITISATLSGGSFGGGKGNDTFTVSGVLTGSVNLEGGAGADQFIIDSGLAASGAYTIIGGAGADRASGDGYVGAGSTGAIFFLNTATESQLGTMDEINVVSESGDNLRVGFSADRSLTSFSGGITGTDGLVAGSGILIASGIAVFSGGLMNAANGNTATITSVTNVLDAALDTVGESTLFTLTGNIANAGNSGVYYIFTQGGATDFLVEVETHSGTLGALQVNTGLTTNTLLVSGG